MLAACSSHGSRKQVTRPGAGKKDVPVIYHQVLYPGESLALIAKWYTGDPGNWRRIADINPDVDPDRIFLDQVIRIPRDLAVKTKPYSLVELRRMQKGSKASSDLASQPERRPEGFDVGYPGPEDEGVESSAGVKHQKAGTTGRKPAAAGEPMDEEAARRREELQEKTRRELLQEMGADSGRY